MQNANKQLFIVILLISIMAAWRVVNTGLGIYHMVPMAALGLFSGSILSDRRWAYGIPLFAMFLSDLGLSIFTSMPGFYDFSQLVNYAALASVVFLGARLQDRRAFNVAGYTLSGSLLFFLISNFGTFLSGYYGYSIQGLIQCYTMAIPFYKSEIATQFFMNSLISDLLFSSIAFGIFYLAITRQKQLAVA